MFTGSARLRPCRPAYLVPMAVLDQKKTFFNLNKVYNKIMDTVLAHRSASVSELKSNPKKVVDGANGSAVAILSHNSVMGYMLSPDHYQEMLEKLEDMELALIAQERLKQDFEPIRVNIDEL